MTRALLFVAFVACALAPGTALAHPLVDEARARFDEAEFEASIRALDRAERADDLSMDDLVEVLRLRILCELALGRESRVEAAAERVLSLDPARALGSEMPPEVHELADRIRARLGGALSISASFDPDRGRILTAIDHDPGRLVREVRIHTRRAGDESYRTTTGDEAEAPESPLEYYAEAIGPGGVVIATDGTAGEPRTHGSEAVFRTEDDDEGTSPWLWIGLGAGAAAVAGVVIAIVVALSSGESNLSRPSYPGVVGLRW
jgi:hypothetical protein